MTEQKLTAVPKQLWDKTLRMVKGDNTLQLVEQFTAEVTLVAEGLAEDQARLNSDVEKLRREQERDAQRLEAGTEALQKSLQENQRDIDRRLDELTKRLANLENQAKVKESRKAKLKRIGILWQVIILTGIVCGSWVLVSLINLLAR